jgi:hypothetical protein
MESLATNSIWFVQNNNNYGTYGIDYVGLAGATIAWIQQYSTILATGASCTVTYPQKMLINSETGAGQESYGSNNQGYNYLVFTVTPTLISVSRGNASSGMRQFHF